MGVGPHPAVASCHQRHWAQRAPPIGKLLRPRCRPIAAATRQNGSVRTLMRVTAVVALALAGNSLAVSSAHADIPELGDCRADAELQVGSTGASVICVQWALLWLGYYHGLVNGTYDQATANAVINFQIDNPPLTVNGNATAQTLIAMNNYSGVDNAPPPACLADAPVEPGDRGPSAECVQQVLAAAGPVQRQGRRHLRQGHPGSGEGLPVRQPAAEGQRHRRHVHPRRAGRVERLQQRGRRHPHRHQLVAVAVPGRAELPGGAAASPCSATTASAARPTPTSSPSSSPRTAPMCPPSSSSSTSRPARVAATTRR